MADAGKIMLTLEGDYDNEKEYERLSMVNTENGSYISKKETQGNDPDEDTDEEFWQEVKSKAKIDADAELSETSTNAIQNKAVALALKDKVGTDDVDSELLTSSTNPIQNAAVANAIGDITDELDTINGAIGDVEDLPEGSENIVGAIGALDTNIGDMSKLPETASDVASAIEAINGKLVELPSTDYLADGKTYKTNDLFIYQNKVYKVKGADGGVSGSTIKTNMATYTDETTIGNEIVNAKNEINAINGVLNNHFEVGQIYSSIVNGSTTRVIDIPEKYRNGLILVRWKYANGTDANAFYVVFKAGLILSITKSNNAANGDLTSFGMANNQVTVTTGAWGGELKVYSVG